VAWYLIVVAIIWALSALSLIILVLMHSGKGTGLSESFGGAFSSNIGTGIIEKNLNRMTIIAAGVFISSLLTLMVIWPKA
jgi:preprotein translocase subunit SecG